MPAPSRMAAATSRWGKARMCCTTLCCGPRTGPIRWHGLSIRNSIATAHSNTARMRCRNRRAVVRLRVPDGSEDLQHIGASDLRHRHLPDTREGIPLEGQHPLAAVRPTSLAGLLLFHHMCGGFGEAWHALRTTFLCERVATLAGQLAVGQRLLPSLGERDQRDPAEPELAAPAVCLPGGRLSRDRRSVRAKRGPVEHQLRPRHRSLLTNL